MSHSTPDSLGNGGLIPGNGETAAEQNGSGRRVGILARVNVSPEAVRTLPAAFVKRHLVLPFEINNGTIHIATADPGNQRVIDDIRLLSGLEVQESVATASEIQDKIAECYQVTVEKMIENLHPEDRKSTRLNSSHLVISYAVFC